MISVKTYAEFVDYICDRLSYYQLKKYSWTNIYVFSWVGECEEDSVTAPPVDVSVAAEVSQQLGSFSICMQADLHACNFRMPTCITKLHAAIRCKVAILLFYGQELVGGGVEELTGSTYWVLPLNFIKKFWHHRKLTFSKWAEPTSLEIVSKKSFFLAKHSVAKWIDGWMDG